MSAIAHTAQQHRIILQRVAHRATLEHGLLPAFSALAVAELRRIDAPATAAASSSDSPPIQDLTGLPWASIDNDDSRDLDQLTVADLLAAHGVAFIRRVMRTPPALCSFLIARWPSSSSSAPANTWRRVPVRPRPDTSDWR